MKKRQLTGSAADANGAFTTCILIIGETQPTDDVIQLQRLN